MDGLYWSNRQIGIHCIDFQLRKELIVSVAFCFREKETEILKDQIEKLNSAILREEEKAKDLEIKSR